MFSYPVRGEKKTQTTDLYKNKEILIFTEQKIVRELRSDL